MGTDKNILYKQLQKYFADKPVKKVFVFGSFARNEQKDSSDIDLIISLSHPVGLFTLGNYVADLEDITKRKIDIATQNSITPDFLALIQKDLKEVYAAWRQQGYMLKVKDVLQAITLIQSFVANENLPGLKEQMENIFSSFENN